MPGLPKRPCRRPGCKALVPGGGFCPEHAGAEAKRRWSAKGGDATPYQSKAWRELRARVLLEEPICRKCPNPSTDVDHIQPVRFRPDLLLVRSNLRGLCRSCHSARTARQYSNGGGA